MLSDEQPVRVPPLAATNAFGGISRFARAEQWWSYKLSPMLAIFYATLLRNGSSIADAGLHALTLLIGIGACAAYVSLSNDLADRRDDRLAGKPNRLEGKPLPFILAVLALPIAIGAGVAWLWRDDLFLLLAFAGSWIAFSAYSLPPFRLKARGILGVIADAAGANGFPALTAVLLAAHATGRSPDLLWCACAAGWSGAFGLRGILWHQLLDADADRASATNTFVQAHGDRVTRAIVQRWVFPAEVLLFLALLWVIPGRAAMFAFGLYGLFLAAKMVRFGVRPVLAAPVPGYLLLLVEFYVVFLPLALLLESAWHYPRDLIVVALHAILFHRPIREVLRDIGLLDLRRVDFS